MKRKFIKTTILLLLLISLVIIPQTGCGDKEPVSGTDEYLDTECTITVYDMGEDDAVEVIEGAFDLIAEYEKCLSKTIKGSDVDRINSSDGQKTHIKDITEDAIKAGLDAGKLSGGNFDITIGRVTDLWDFKAQIPKLPSDDSIESAVATVDYKQVTMDGQNVTLANPEAKIDLGGIAKGYVADKTAEYLEAKGVKQGLINLGGNIVAIGNKDGGGYVIGIERPYSDRTEIVGTVEVKNQTVVTSGIYERKFEYDGELYHHILDPATGYPAVTDLEAVTIVADKGYSCFCDGLSTSCLMAGLDGAQELIRKVQREHPEMHLEASFIDKNDKVIKTKGMKITPVE